jgi:hypothetical protein
MCENRIQMRIFEPKLERETPAWGDYSMPKKQLRNNEETVDTKTRH